MSRAKTRPPTGANRRRASSVAATGPYQALRANSVGDDQLVDVTELAEAPVLQIAIHDGAPHVATARDAIADAGHVAAAAAYGREGLATIADAVRSGAIDAVIVGLPGGESVIDAALELGPSRPLVIASCTGNPIDAIARATMAGADLVTIRPHEGDRLALLLLAAARLVDERRRTLAALGAEAVLRDKLDELTDPDTGGLQPLEIFQRVLEQELRRARRYQYPLAVALFAVSLAPPPPPGVLGILRARAGNALVNSIRDIDLATELDQDRFFVLLPHTDLEGGETVARRVIDTVAAEPPVVASGSAFVPRLIGGVASAQTGAKTGATAADPLSFARLVHDATRALDQARAAGTDLGVVT